MNHRKQFACILLAVVMVFSLATTVCAANGIDGDVNTTKHTITVEGAQVGHTYAIYQIFLGDCSALNGRTNLLNVTLGSGVDPEVKIEGKTFLETLNSLPDFRSCVTPDDFARVISGYEDNSYKLDELAKVIVPFLGTSCGQVDRSDPTLEVTGDGYYFLVDNASTQSDYGPYTKNVFVYADTENETVKIKADAPSFEKGFVESDERAISASVGDKIEFEILSNVPVMDGYNQYYFVIYDTLSEGLTFNDDVTVTIGGKKLMQDSVNLEKDYYLDVENNTIKIVLRDFYSKYSSDSFKNAQIKVTYSATVNECVDLVNGETNSAYLVYSNNPNYVYSGENEPAEGEPVASTQGDPNGTVKIFSIGLVLSKYDPEGNILTGAQFQIKGATSFPVINNGIFRQSNKGTYYRLKDGTYTTDGPNDSTEIYYESKSVKYEKVTLLETGVSANKIQSTSWVDCNGMITYTGLGEGTYSITEKVSPAGCKLLEKPVAVEISFELDENDIPQWTVRINNRKYDVNSDGYVEFGVENAYKAKLPATGGVGANRFFFTGMVLVLLAVFLLMKKYHKFFID